MTFQMNFANSSRRIHLSSLKESTAGCQSRDYCIGGAFVFLSCIESTRKPLVLASIAVTFQLVSIPNVGKTSSGKKHWRCEWNSRVPSYAFSRENWHKSGWLVFDDKMFVGTSECTSWHYPWPIRSINLQVTLQSTWNDIFTSSHWVARMFLLSETPFTLHSLYISLLSER